MTSNCDVTKTAHHKQMTTICHWMNPPMKIFCVRHCTWTTLRITAVQGIPKKENGTMPTCNPKFRTKTYCYRDRRCHITWWHYCWMTMCPYICRFRRTTNSHIFIAFCFGIELDESTDVWNASQLMVSCRFSNYAVAANKIIINFIYAVSYSSWRKYQRFSVTWPSFV